MGRRRRVAVVAGLALAVLSACGGDQGATGSAPDTDPTTTTAEGGERSTPEIERRAAPGSPVVTDLRRRDVPPAGVPAQLDFFEARIRPAPCPIPGRAPAVRPTPAVQPTPATSPIGAQVRICVSGFEPDLPVSLEVSLPDGRTRQRPETGPGENSWFFEVGPADSTGAYGITATQGQKRAQGDFTVVLPDKPLIVALAPSAGPPGTAFEFAVVGAAPNQSFPIDLYAPEENGYRFVTSVRSVATDGSARDSFQLPTGRDAPAGRYYVVARGFEKTSNASFVVL